ncbi:10768_t:CDS:2 [Dentiscutata erythropus]|uniref:Mannosyltransferase n=1 Tax=Dentiscutata erythropus TaxID=1348616 RepID=A0A9N8ZSK9_9GLOM|nr:10768_t:CDS:2 [Dentiscutata erythropus]
MANTQSHTPPNEQTAIIFIFAVLELEESFNLQASHDIMEFGISLEALKKYDHFEFPGVVPRTFVGPLLLSLVSWPTSKTLELLIPHLIRFFLGISTSFALSYFRSSIAKYFGYRVSVAFGILSVCQFHTIFWASRTLPNMFAFPLVGVLLAVIVLFELWIGTLNFFDTLWVGIISGATSLGNTFINEFLALSIATFGKLDLCGQKEMFFISMPFSERVLNGGLLTPMLAFIGGFSFLGHKEWRFIIYVVPIFNLCAAIGWITITMMVIISSHNYPGGVALQKIHVIQRDYSQARIHLDVYTAMTGASRFGQLRHDWMYYKNESHSLPTDYVGYTHLLTSTPHFHGAYFEIIDTVYGYERILLKNPSTIIQNWLKSFQNFDLNHVKNFLESLLLVQIVIEPKVWIMKRHNISDFTEGENLF